MEKKYLYLIVFVLLNFNFTKSQTESKEILELIFKNRRYDFGIVQQDRIISIPFYFKNESNKVISIKILSNSCNCTKSELNKSSLKPNEEGFIKVELDTKGKEGDVAVYAVIEATTKQRYYRVLLVGKVKKITKFM